MQNIKIPQQFSSITTKILQTATENNFEIYIVGGFVRDLILGRPAYDLDILVAGKNEEIRDAGMKLAEILSKKYKTIAPVLFKRFGTAKLIIDGEDIEFVMPRKEFYTEDSRNPDTELAPIEQDALRRDFTVNALFLRLSDMQILDLTKKGIQDIQNKIIRVTDSTAAEFIFNQDPLRILRAIRQSLQLDFSIEKNTFAAMKAMAERIVIVSPERIRDELNKMLIEDNPSRALEIMDEINILPLILPDIKKLQGLSQPKEFHDDDVYIHTLKVLDRTPNVLPLRIAALFHDTGKLAAYNNQGDRITFLGHEKKGAEIAEKTLWDLKYSKEFISQIVNIVKNHMRPHFYEDNWTDAAIRRLVNSCGNDLENVLSLAKADYGKDMPNKRLTDLEERIKKLKKENMLCPDKIILNGNELMEHFNLKPGKWIGLAQNKIMEATFENPRLTKETALEIVKQMLEKMSS